MGKHRRLFAEWVRRRERTWRLAVGLGLASLAAVLVSLTAIDRGTASHVLSMLLIVELTVIILLSAALLAFCRTDRG